jgi:hypothetical protein
MRYDAGMLELLRIAVSALIGAGRTAAHSEHALPRNLAARRFGRMLRLSIHIFENLL